MAFGPHGPRTPTSQPGDGLKIFLAVTGLIGATVVLHQAVRSFGMSFPLFCVLCWLGLAHLVEIARNQVNQNQSRCPRNGRRPRTSVLLSRNSILSLVRFLELDPLFPRIPVLLIGLLTASSSSSRLSSYPYQYSGCRDSNQLFFFFCQVSPRRATQEKVSSNRNRRIIPIHVRGERYKSRSMGPVRRGKFFY